ncbi:MAG: PAS domain S-box protein [Atribacterota bacterium]
MKPLRVLPSGTSLHLLFLTVGAVILMFSMFRYFREEERLQEEFQYTKNLLIFILQYIPDHVYIKDRQSRFVDASMSLVRHFGLTRKEDLLGKTDFDFFANPHAEEAFSDEKRIMESGTPIVGKEEEEIWPDGRNNWVLTSKIPWKDATGKVIGIVGISRDITPLITQRKKLEENERFLSAIFESIQDGLCVIDRDMTIVQANRFLEEMYPEERPLAGKKCYHLFHWGEHPCENCPTLKAFATGASATQVRPYVRKGEQVGWLEIISYPIQDEYGTVQGVIEQVRNITKRIQDEEELKAREENFRLLAESNPSAIFIYQDNRFVYVNPEAERLTGYSREELIGMPVANLIHPDFVSLALERAERRQKNLPVEKQYELKIVTKDGKERWLFLSAETIFYRGRWAGLVSAMDITEKKSTERKNLHLKMVLERIRNVNQLLSRAKEPAALLEKVCQEMVEDETYFSSLIYLVNRENPHFFHAGIEQDKLAEWMEFLKQYDFSAVYQSVVSLRLLPPEQVLLVTPIRYQERILGIIAVAMPAEFAENQEEQALLVELSDDLAFGMYNLELQKVQKTMQKTWKRAKDDFEISWKTSPWE